MKRSGTHLLAVLLCLSALCPLVLAAPTAPPQDRLLNTEEQLRATEERMMNAPTTEEQVTLQTLVQQLDAQLARLVAAATASKSPSANTNNTKQQQFQEIRRQMTLALEHVRSDQNTKAKDVTKQDQLRIQKDTRTLEDDREGARKVQAKRKEFLLSLKAPVAPPASTPKRHR